MHINTPLVTHSGGIHMCSSRFHMCTTQNMDQNQRCWKPYTCKHIIYLALAIPSTAHISRMHIHKAYTCTHVDDVKRAMHAYPYAYILCMYRDIPVCMNIDTHMCPSSVHIYRAYIYRNTRGLTWMMSHVQCTHFYMHIYCAHIQAYTCAQVDDVCA